jgi:hypothetical protein
VGLRINLHETTPWRRPVVAGADLEKQWAQYSPHHNFKYNSRSTIDSLDAEEI